MNIVWDGKGRGKGRKAMQRTGVTARSTCAIVRYWVVLIRRHDGLFFSVQSQSRQPLIFLVCTAVLRGSLHHEEPETTLLIFKLLLAGRAWVGEVE